jgi:hypothetical protein
MNASIFQSMWKHKHVIRLPKLQKNKSPYHEEKLHDII